MRYFLLVLLCFSLTGCTTIFKTKKLENQVIKLQAALLKKDEDLRLKEDKLKGKELEVDQLRKELEKFGVFH